MHNVGIKREPEYTIKSAWFKAGIGAKIASACQKGARLVGVKVTTGYVSLATKDILDVDGDFLAAGGPPAKNSSFFASLPVLA
jgi:hypothetical protein